MARTVSPVRPGFTFLEIIVGIGIIAILGAVVVSSLVAFRRSSELDSSLREAMAVMRLAREKTLASESDAQYGVHFETNTVTLFRGSFVPGAATNEVASLPRSVSIDSVDISGGGGDIIFQRLTGYAEATGTVTFLSRGETRVLTVEAAGGVRAEAGSLPPAGLRWVDTRHVDFTLGWTIQNATTFRFRFSNPPGADVMRDIPFSSVCTGTPWAWCDWSEPVTVGESQEVLRIYTKVISASDTTLSVIRDRRFNTKSVIVSIVDGGITKDIASYTTTGTTTVGAYGGVTTTQ